MLKLAQCVSFLSTLLTKFKRLSVLVLLVVVHPLYPTCNGWLLIIPFFSLYSSLHCYYCHGSILGAKVLFSRQSYPKCLISQMHRLHWREQQMPLCLSYVEIQTSMVFYQVWKASKKGLTKTMAIHGLFWMKKSSLTSSRGMLPLFRNKVLGVSYLAGLSKPCLGGHGFWSSIWSCSTGSLGATWLDWRGSGGWESYATGLDGHPLWWYVPYTPHHEFAVYENWRRFIHRKSALSKYV